MTFASFIALANGPASPFRGQESREIKALSNADIESLLAGKGMGLAKTAELNGWPDPRHVIDLAEDLAEDLELTASQLSESKALFGKMQADLPPEAVRDATDLIARLEGKLRAVHLNAHIAQADILTARQGSLYVELRGYDHASDGSHGKGANRH